MDPAVVDEPRVPAGPASLSALYVYPVKSCRGIAVAQAVVTPRGFAGDRRWMFVDASGRFITQREVAELSLVDAAFDAASLVLSAPGVGAIRLPAEYEEGSELDVSIWKDAGRAVRHPDGSAWISELLGRESSLVFMAERHERPVDPVYSTPGDRVSFADGFPFLVISDASLADLNARLAQPVGMDRFRPNIVVGGVEAFAEDTWSRVRMGSIMFRGPKPCARCAIPSIDPTTATKGKEPLRTLAAYRTWEGKIWFGMNLIGDGVGLLSIGDAVESL